MGGLDPSRRDSLEKADDRCRAAAQATQDLAVPPVHRCGAGDPLAREMVHQAEEERQIGRVNPPLVQREDEAPAAR